MRNTPHYVLTVGGLFIYDTDNIFRILSIFPFTSGYVLYSSTKIQAGEPITIPTELLTLHIIYVIKEANLITLDKSFSDPMLENKAVRTASNLVS
jgi:hypothetical protein